MEEEEGANPTLSAACDSYAPPLLGVSDGYGSIFLFEFLFPFLSLSFFVSKRKLGVVVAEVGATEAQVPPSRSRRPLASGVRSIQVWSLGSNLDEG